MMLNPRTTTITSVHHQKDMVNIHQGIKTHQKNMVYMHTSKASKQKKDRVYMHTSSQHNTSERCGIYAGNKHGVHIHIEASKHIRKIWYTSHPQNTERCVRKHIKPSKLDDLVYIISNHQIRKIMGYINASIYKNKIWHTHQTIKDLVYIASNH
ncbi:hypothetical protein CHS0354_008004 [Potamilus streckersoni]|uniref:Uncharacterized protein n=1 Tax=Potamilus streckersoni TaxID=2493646 RepID=A0AAE0SCB4_9BIVA|nr:hypothetical protein CHS0354_008004 [Potamilus streckersoni]